jgi:PAS domain S-box-containing protein
MLEILQNFSDKSFIFYNYSYFWKPILSWLHVTSDVMIALSYFSIALILVDLGRQFSKLPFQRDQQNQTEGQESSQRLSLLVQQTPLAVIEWNTDFEVVAWNPAAEKIFGYSKGEALGRQAVELIVPQTAREQVNQIWKQLLWQQGGMRSTNENLTKEGREIYCEWYNTPLIDAKGQVIGVASLVQDVTEQKLAQEALQQAKDELETRVEDRTQELKQALAEINEVIAHLQSEMREREEVEAALREREEQYQSVVDNVKEVIFQTDVNGLWTFLNPAWSEITGFAIADSLGTLFLDYVHPDDRQRNQEQFQPLIERKKEYCRHEVRYLTAQGSYCWIEVFAQLTFDADGTVTGTCGTLYDITERHLSEAALREREETFRQLTENIREVFFLTSPDLSQILYISPAFEEVWGRTTQSLYEKPRSWIESIHPEDRDRVIALSKQSLREEQDFNVDYRIVRPDGLVRWVWVRSSLIRNEAGLITRLAGIAEDVTERKQAEAEILNALSKEKELGDLKSRFISITSHEFRTPLTTIMSTAELLEYYEWTQQEKRQQLHLIKESVEQMLQLLEDLLFIGTADAGQLQFNPEPLDLKEFCQQLVIDIQRGTSLKQIAQDSQLILTQSTITFVSSNQTCLACMDKKLLRQLLYNLISNAMKYSPDHNPIQFELTCQGDQAVFQIQDRGIGIPKEDQSRVFEFFHRAKNVGAIAGTGLGLAIVKQCVDLHGGDITVDSEVGIGTRFTVTLPLKNHFSIAPYAK